MIKKSGHNPFGPSLGKSYYIGKREDGIDWFKSSPKEESKNNQTLTPFLGKRKVQLWVGILILSAAILLARVSYVQLIRGHDFKSIAEGNRVRIRDIKVTRGVIYDRYNNLLAENVPSLSLVVIPVDLPNNEEEVEEIINRLSKITGQPQQEIRRLIKEQPSYSYQPVLIKENLDFEEAVLAKIESYNYPGVVLKVDSSRNYLVSKEVPSVSHILGYLGKINPNDLDFYLAAGYSLDDYVGLTGVELSYEETLKGRNGKEYVEVDAFGEVKKVLAYQEPEAGDSLVLTIDLELQKEVERILKKTLDVYNKKKASVIVLDPNSGEILSLVSWPAFDNNLFVGGISQEELEKLINEPDQPLFSRSISGEYPSGSTFKLIIASAALQEKLITPQTSFNSVGGIAVDRWFFPDWKAGGHGWTNVIKALSESVNTFFYIIGGGYEDFDGLGVRKIKKYAELFGLNQKLGLDLPNEASGFLPSPEWKEEAKKEIWYIGDTYHLAIGQGDILVTPLQVAVWTSVFANGGTLYKPHLVKSFLDIDNNQTEVKPEVLRKNFIDQDYIKIVNQGLRQAVLSGSAKSLYDLPLSIAAKTGTAQWSTKKSPHGWLTAFAPYQNPELVVTVLVEEGEEGSITAVPIARDIINWWSANR
ncbi:MAG: penicillin-binding protein 2 [Candidatus Buchananbacteria bacterium RIFCSPHIGHO2_01_FULL_39_8]|uniref:Penicillin-binding protein 2 n=1 Tax=Candidatus Buchananbacteria bacterium RIFCSPHIGHO2_01_FULL_39_8 TaxID=1797533 RepID=A0A1G1XXD5_9BACT|nr:hypothetical protein [uncultured bacterium]OGY44240.1 MAG: penicillin-binding protein 2 [Candidatus Buchananbacteria bacterium RIFCSPHIGHO2_01_FULL_39_8]